MPKVVAEVVLSFRDEEAGEEEIAVAQVADCSQVYLSLPRSGEVVIIPAADAARLIDQLKSALDGDLGSHPGATTYQ